MNSRTQLHWKIAFCIWLVVVTVATHTPAMQESETQTFVSPDKLFHFISFGVLAMLFWCAGWVKQKRITLLLFLLWSLVDEATQAILPLDRPFSFADLFASMLGVIAAASWMGSLSMPQLQNLRKKIDTLFSKTITWFVLCPVAIIGTVGSSAVMWLYIWKTYLVSCAPFSLCIGLLLTAVALLMIISLWAQCLEKDVVKALLPKVFFLGIISIIMGFATSRVEVGPYTIGLAFFTIGFASVWRATITDLSVEGTM